MDISNFFQSLPDKRHKFFFPKQVIENILIMKTAIILTAISLLISSLALLILALAHYRFKSFSDLLEQDLRQWNLPENIGSEIPNADPPVNPK